MSFERMDLKKADYSHWNHVAFVTLNEFIYLAIGCEPLHIGTYGNGYLNLSNNDVKEFYKRVKRLGEELPWTTTNETEIHDSLKPESRYEAVYLIKWATSKNIPISSHYRPIMSPERIKANHLNRMLGMDIVTIDDSAAFFAVFNPLRMAKNILKICC